jgi:hypothetical protein
MGSGRIYFLAGTQLRRYELILENLGTLLNVMPGAQQLHVFGRDRRASLRVGQDVIEVQFVCCTTFNTPAAVALPNLQLHRRWDHPSPIRVSRRRTTKVFFSFDGHEFVLEHLPVTVFLPRIHEVENPVV